jgi:glutamate-1-semialdehyde 2,1-aminomutase
MSVDEAVEQFTQRYARALRGSHALAARANAVLAGRAAHDSWELTPFAPVMERAEGPYKWDVDGRRYVDYWMGHGSLLLGHSAPVVLAAVARQAQRGTHLGGLHRLLIEWAEQIVQLVPSAQRVRFTSSGTEATLLALRVARAFTGRPVVARLDGHYHGWHDEALAGVLPNAVTGLHPGADEYLEIVDGDPDRLAARLRHGDVAGVILEPGGGSCGALPWSTEWLRALRAATRAHGTLLIFDEVVSGFRYAPGGVQALSDVLPDLTVLGKIVAGGCPGGVVVGRADVMRTFGSDADPSSSIRAHITHAGTFNANPVSAAAGIATLHAIADGTHQGEAARSAAALARGINEAAIRHCVDVRMFAVSSIVHLVPGALAAGEDVGPSTACFALMQQKMSALRRFRLALLIAGVDMHPSRGWVSSAHTPEVVDQAVTAFDRAFEFAADDGPFGGDCHERSGPETDRASDIVRRCMP